MKTPNRKKYENTNNLINTTMKYTYINTLAAFAGLALTATSANAALLAVDFGAGPVESGFVGQSAASATHSTTAGNITAAWTGGIAFNYAPPNTTGSNTDLYQDFFYTNSGPMTLELSGPGISANTDYVLSFWSQYQAQARNTTFTAASGTVGTTLGPIATSNAPATGLTDPIHFISGTFTSDGTGKLTISAGSNRPAVNGVQIDAVPEPSTTALLGLGGLALILRRRK